MKVRSLWRMMCGVLKVIVFVSYLGYFVAETASNSTCTCMEKIKASVSLEGCKCHLTNYCMKEFWSNSNSAPLHDESAMDVTLSPFKRSFTIAYPSLPAFNITFVVNDEKIKGLTFVYRNGCILKNASICRFLDFNSYKSTIKKAVFYSDEIHFESPWGNSCPIEVIGLNNQLVPIYYKKFLTKVPDIDSLELNCERLSKWQSFVTLDQTSYKEESMGITFTTPPEQCNVTSFILRLIENNKLKSLESLEQNTYVPALYKRLNGIRSGVIYKVEIEINNINNALCKGPCAVSSSSTFAYEVQDSGIHMLHIVFIVTGILSITLIAAIIWIRRRKSTRIYDKVVKVFIAYSHDIEQHRNVIKLFAEYLKQYCYCEVKLDMWDVGIQDPHLWVSECISAADYILIIWSRGAQLKMRKDNTKILITEPGYLGNDLFSTAMTSITSKISKELRTPQYWRNLRKFVNVSFPYFPTNEVPSQYGYLPFFQLPSGFNALLWHLHGFDKSHFPFSLFPSLTSFMSCCHCYPKLPFSNINETKEGIKLLRAINEMNMLEKQGDWLKLLQMEYHRMEGVGQISDDFKDSDSDNGDCAPDSCSINSEQSETQVHVISFPPPVHTLPIYGPESCEAPNANGSSFAQSSDCSPTSDRWLLHESYNFDTADHPLIFEDHQMTLPLDIYGPCEFEPNK